MQHGATLLSWSCPIVSAAFTDGANAILYPTLVGEGSDPATGNGNPWLIYIDATSWPSWPSATYVSRRLQLADNEVLTRFSCFGALPASAET